MAKQPHERILCCNVLPSDRAEPSIFRHPIFSYEEDVAWPPSGWQEVACNYCFHSFDTPPVPIPLFHERKEDVWHVFGISCSWNCAKRELFEKHGYNCGERALLLEQLARGRFQYDAPGPILPAPPRSRLKRFSGPGPDALTIEEFRAESANGYCTAVVSPPLLSCPQVYERYAPNIGTVPWSVKGIRARPSNTSQDAGSGASSSADANRAMYSGFTKSKRGDRPDPGGKSEAEGTLLDWRALSASCSAAVDNEDRAAPESGGGA